MIKTDDLHQSITDLGDRVRMLSSGSELYNILQRGHMARDDVSSSLKTLVDYYGQFQNLSIRTFMALRHDTPELPPYQILLALNIPNHDLDSRIDVIRARAKHIRIQKDEHKILGYLSRYEHFRNDLLMIPYIATGDKKYLTRIEDQYDFVKWVTAAGKGQVVPDFTMDHTTLYNDHCFITAQLVKNARKAIEEAKLMSPIVDNNVPVTVYQYKNHMSISVTDRGCGIGWGRLPDIFEGCSTWGTGTGLQLVKQMVALRKGYIDVVSVECDKDAFCYDTFSNTIKKQKPQKLKRGTQITVHLSR